MQKLILTILFIFMCSSVLADRVRLTWVSTVDNVITYSLSRKVGSHETLTSLRYTQPTGGITDTSSSLNELASIPDASGYFTNDSELDTVPPTLSSVVIPELGTTVEFNFSEEIEENGDGSNWYVFNMTDGAVDLSSSSVVDQKITYDISNRTVKEDEELVKLSYGTFNPAAGAEGFVDNIEDLSGNQLEPIADYDGTFTNNSEVDGTNPTVTQVDVLPSGDEIKITFSETVALGITSDGSDWKFIMDASETEIVMSSPSLDDDEITYSLDRVVMKDESLSELDFTKDGYGIADEAENLLDSIDDYDGTFNNNSSQVPEIVSVSATDDEAWEKDGDTGTFTFTCLPTCDSVSVNWTLSGTATLNTAEESGDYDLDDEDGTIVISGTSATITLTPVDDENQEAVETAILTITASEDYSVVENEATIKIWPDDGDIEGAVSVTGVSIQ